jgi:putative YpdA family bacillithiol system oxidoreductase
MEILYSLAIGLAATFFFLRRYLKTLSSRPASAQHRAQERTSPCPRCGKPVAVSASFCAACGAALALWNVHRATEILSAAPTTTGKLQPVINATLCIGCGSCVEACPETGTLEVISGKAILAHPERCTAHSKCAEVCPTSAIALSAGGVRQTLRVPRVRENFETNVTGLFIVGELGGMGLIKTAINEGRLVIDHVKARTPVSTQADDAYDLVIVGAGPAGLSASMAALQHGLKYVTLEQGDIASTIRQYPRNKFLMAEPIEMPLYGSLYVADGTKEALLAVWETILANTGVQVQTNERVETVKKSDDGLFLVATSKALYKTRNVVLALGKRGTPRRLNIKGEEMSKVAYRLIEADSYDDRDILIVGGGDSAMEAALALSRRTKNRVTLSYRGESFQRGRDRNRKQLDEAEANGELKILLNSQVREIGKEHAVIEKGGSIVTIRNDFVFVLIGGESPEEFLRKVGVEIVEKTIGAA